MRATSPKRLPSRRTSTRTRSISSNSSWSWKISSGSRSRTRTPSRSRQSGRPSTTSRATSRKQGQEQADLGRLIDQLPAERLRHAFTHASWAADRAESYERLEFLGDSVLGLAIARELYERFPTYQEGRLA